MERDDKSHASSQGKTGILASVFVTREALLNDK